MGLRRLIDRMMGDSREKRIRRIEARTERIVRDARAVETSIRRWRKAQELLRR